MYSKVKTTVYIVGLVNTTLIQIYCGRRKPVTVNLGEASYLKETTGTLIGL